MTAMDISVRSEGPWLPEDRSWLASDHGTTATRTITLDVSAFTEGTHFPNGFIPSGTVLARLASGLYGPYAGRTAEVQTVTVTGVPTGGTFTLTHEGATTAAIAYNAAASAVRTALEALPGIAPGDVTVTGSAGGPYTVTFTRGGGDVAAMTASGASLTGGTSPDVTIATPTAGASTGTGGTETPAGHLFNSTKVVAGGADVGAPLFEHGFVRVDRLPANSGFDSYVRTALAGRITYRP
jgi:hypothetical protein